MLLVVAGRVLLFTVAHSPPEESSIDLQQIAIMDIYQITIFILARYYIAYFNTVCFVAVNKKKQKINPFFFLFNDQHGNAIW